MVVNDALARKYFPDGRVLNQRIESGFGDWARIVGIVENALEANLADGPEPARYMLATQVPYSPRGQTLVLRTARPTDAPAVLEAARRTVQRVAPSFAVQKATTMEQVLTEAIGPARQVMSLLTLLTALALLLVAIGVYGVIAHHVSRRQRDYSIRVALGLLPNQVLRLVLGRGAALVGLGLALGVAAALALSRGLAALLYGVRPADPVTLLGAILVLMAVGLLAAFVPALRASRIDPARVLSEQ